MIYDKICPHGDDDVYSLSCYLCHGLILMTALTLLCVFNSCDYSHVQNRTHYFTALIIPALERYGRNSKKCCSEFSYSELAFFISLTQNEEELKRFDQKIHFGLLQ